MATPDTATEAAKAATGMPQLDPSVFPNLMVQLVIALVAIYLILNRVALPRISAVLAERQGSILNDIAAADDLKRKAAEAEEAYNKALADARAEAQRIAGETRAEIQNDLADANAKADAEIAAKTVESEKAIAEIRANAVESVRAVANDTAAEIVKALGRQADTAKIADAVETGMKG